MLQSKADIISRLQKDILPLQGFKPVANDAGYKDGLSLIRHAFPNARFPLGAVHEFFCNGAENVSASAGFVAGILSSLMKKGSASIWISAERLIFPPALKLFGIDPSKIIFIDLKKEKEMVWAMEEALKCDGLAAVIGEIQEISFTGSRRFQLAVEQSRVTGFLLRRNPRNLATACVTRWKINHLKTETVDDLPGLRFPRWNVELLKVRNGKPGSWQMEWRSGKFHHVYKPSSVIEEQRKTG